MALDYLGRGDCDRAVDRWIAAFSFYASRFGSYDATYGSLAAPVILLLWFWVSALTVLVGAEIDAELEHADGRAARPVPKSAP
jgi:uncharacterized BrkB/YihY/UPF0761 family membrane protein